MSLNTQTEHGVYFRDIMRSFSPPPYTEPSKRQLCEQNNTVTCHIPHISIYKIQEEAFSFWTSDQQWTSIKICEMESVQGKLTWKINIPKIIFCVPTLTLIDLGSEKLVQGLFMTFRGSKYLYHHGLIPEFLKYILKIYFMTVLVKRWT